MPPEMDEFTFEQSQAFNIEQEYHWYYTAVATRLQIMSVDVVNVLSLLIFFSHL